MCAGAWCLSTARPGWEDTLFVITSDHGEGLSDHPDVANSLNNLARLYYQRGDFARAERFYVDLLGLACTARYRRELVRHLGREAVVEARQEAGI